MTTKGFHTGFLFYTPHTRCAVGIAGDTIVSSRRNGNGQHSATPGAEDFTSAGLDGQQSGQALWVAHQPVRLRTVTPTMETVETLLRGLEDPPKQKRKCRKGVQKYINLSQMTWPGISMGTSARYLVRKLKRHVFSIIIIFIIYNLSYVIYAYGSQCVHRNPNR